MESCFLRRHLDIECCIFRVFLKEFINIYEINNYFSWRAEFWPHQVFKKISINVLLLSRIYFVTLSVSTTVVKETWKILIVISISSQDRSDEQELAVHRLQSEEPSANHKAANSLCENYDSHESHVSCMKVIVCKTSHSISSLVYVEATFLMKICK